MTVLASVEASDERRPPNHFSPPYRSEIMSLFGFAKHIGRKIIGKESEADEKVREFLEADNPGIQNLGVKVNGDIVELSGDTSDPEAVEKAVLMAGNIEGIGEVKIQGLKSPPLSTEVDYYEIRSGDTLSKIAKAFYGDANTYGKIFEANREVIKDPDLIFVGQKIRIPKNVA
jgi:nucleoid-associated protein YgaU